MRVVLLSTLEPATGAGGPRGFLRLGGRPVVQHQLAAAVSLGCEKAYCLADGFPRELIALQALAEAAGVSFRVVASGHDLARLVSPTDDVLVFLDGLVPSLGQLAAVSETGSGVIVIPADLATGGGFERIDLNHAWSGFMRIPGVLLLRLTELPSDWNPLSTLLRIAAQAGLPQRPMPRAAVAEGRWMLLRTEADARRIEPSWLRSQTSHRARLSPGSWLAAQFLQRLGPTLLNAGIRGIVLTLLSVVLGLLGLASAWAGIHAGGFLLIGAAWLAQESAGLLGLVDGGAGFRRRLPSDMVMPWFIDALLALVCTSRLAGGDSFVLLPLQAALASLTFVGILRLVGQLAAGRRLANWLEDRLTTALLLAAASFAAPFSVVVMAASLMLVVVALVLASVAGKTATAGKRLA